MLWLPSLIEITTCPRRSIFFLFRSLIVILADRFPTMLHGDGILTWREREKAVVSCDVPAYAWLYLFQNPRTYPILTPSNKSDARIHGYK